MKLLWQSSFDTCTLNQTRANASLLLLRAPQKSSRCILFKCPLRHPRHAYHKCAGARSFHAAARPQRRAPFRAKAVSLLLLLPAVFGIVRLLSGLVDAVQDGFLYGGNWLVNVVSFGSDSGLGAAGAADGAGAVSAGSTGSELPSGADSLTAELSGEADPDHDPAGRLSAHLGDLLRLGLAPEELWAAMLAGLAAASAAGGGGGAAAGGVDPAAVGVLSGLYVRYLAAWLVLQLARACGAAFLALLPLQRLLLAAESELLSGSAGTLLRAVMLMLPSLVLALRLPWLGTLLHVVWTSAAERCRLWLGRRQRGRGRGRGPLGGQGSQALALAAAAAEAAPGVSRALRGDGRETSGASQYPHPHTHTHPSALGRGAGPEGPLAGVAAASCAPAAAPAAAAVAGQAAAVAALPLAAGGSAAVLVLEPPHQRCGEVSPAPRLAATATLPAPAPTGDPDALRQLRVASPAPAGSASTPPRPPEPSGRSPRGEHGEAVSRSPVEAQEAREGRDLTVNVLRVAAMLGACAAATVAEAGTRGPWQLRLADMAVTAASSGAALGLLREVWARGGGAFLHDDAAQPLRLAALLAVAQAGVGVAHAAVAGSWRSCLLPLLAGAFACHNCMRLRDDPAELYRQVAYLLFPVVLAARLVWLHAHGVAV